MMDRVTLRIPEQQIDEVEELVEAGRYPNRSEAIRTAVRKFVTEERKARRADGGDDKLPWRQSR